MPYVSTVTPATTPALFHRLLDDAAVFPPGLAPVDVAVTEFRRRASGPYADLVGPLLIGAGAVGPLIDVVTGDTGLAAAKDGGAGPAPVDLALVARPGTPLTVLADAVSRVRAEAAASLALTGVELAHSPGWRAALEWGLPVAVEIVGPPESVIGQLDDVARVRADGHPVRTKLRTQSTPDTPLPEPAALGAFLLWCVRHRLPFKLTGGLHHAAPTRATAPDGGTETQHGLLNVLLATELADASVWGTAPTGPGATAAHPSPDAESATVRERVISTLAETDPRDLARRTSELTDDRAAALRRHFTSYGCCGVLDPIGELTALALLAPAASPEHPAETTPEDEDA